MTKHQPGIVIIFTNYSLKKSRQNVRFFFNSDFWLTFIRFCDLSSFLAIGLFQNTFVDISDIVRATNGFVFFGASSAVVCILLLNLTFTLVPDRDLRLVKARLILEVTLVGIRSPILTANRLVCLRTFRVTFLCNGKTYA